MIHLELLALAASAALSAKLFGAQAVLWRSRALLVKDSHPEVSLVRRDIACWCMFAAASSVAVE